MKVKAQFVGTNGQLADILTQALGRVRFAELRAKIGMVEVTMAHALGGDIVGINPGACHIIFLLFSPCPCYKILGGCPLFRIPPLITNT